MRILVVDDEEMKRLSLAQDLGAWGHRVVTAADGQEALDRIRDGEFDVVIADLKMPRLDGMELLKQIKSGPAAGTEVVIITAYGSIPVAVEAMRRGAFDFITKPFSNESLLPVLQRVAHLRSESAGGEGPGARPDPAEPSLVGASPAMAGVLDLVDICARSDANVLVCGETGTGKDLVASVIHKHSSRRSHPFVKVSCAVFPQELISSELYGHEKGAFTGADRLRTGRLDLAAGGTLYLDDVDDIPSEEQGKLLRVIEERVFERVGGNAQIRADVRIIASSKRDLLLKIREGTFREDLYYRLNILRIDLPPLRDRLEDLAALTAHLLQAISGQEKVIVAPDVVGVLAAHTWPGNVRELRNTLERAYLVGRGAVTADQLVRQIGRAGGGDGGGAPRDAFTERVSRFERDLLERALKATGGNKTAAARLLGMKPSTFRDRLGRHGL